jgi:hypothetical protein
MKTESDSVQSVLCNRISWGALFVLLLPFMAALFYVLASGVPDLSTSGDGALLEISTRNLASGKSLTGPYSRFGFHHPGPAYFLARIPLYFLFDSSSSSSYLTVSLINILSLAGIFLLLKKNAGSIPSIAFCLIAAMYLRSIQPAIWLSEWNAFVVILPLFITVITLAAVGSGLHRYLPLAVLSGSFTVQTHIGSILVVMIISITAGILYFVPNGILLPATAERTASGNAGKNLLIAFVLLAVLWSPVVVEQFSSGPDGNITAILSFFKENQPEPVTLEAVEDWRSAASCVEVSCLNPSFLRRTNSLGIVKIVVLAIRFSALILCWFLLKRRGGNRFIASLCLLALILHVVTFLSILQIRGVPHSYLFTWISFISPLSWVAIAGAVIELSRLGERKYSLIICLLAALTLITVVTAANLGLVSKGEAGPYDPLDIHDERIPLLSDSLSRHLDTLEGGSWFIRLGDHDLWPVMTGIVNRLSKLGYDIEVDPAYSFMTAVSPDSVAAPLFLTSDTMIGPFEFEVLVEYDGILLKR